MAKNGNGEGSIYPHKKNGKKVGYPGAYWVHTAEGPKRRYVSGKTLERQLAEMERMGSLYQPGGLIFATESGTLINPSNLRNRSFKPLLRRAFGAAGPDICFHDLRHTCATLLLTQGTHPKLVQELLGHATTAMTLDTYSHFLPSMGEQSVKAMEAALS
jgi:integrase